jgi:tRNA(adenine34) deaminase
LFFGLGHGGEEHSMSEATNQAREGQDAHFMQLALKQAEIAVNRGQTPFGAIVVDRSGRLIGEGHNSVRADLDPAAHGEIVAIRSAWRHLGQWQMLAGSTLYSSCEPCLLCSFVITQIGFARVVFAARGRDIPTYKPLLGADLTEAAAWVNAQPDWPQVELVGDFMRDRALKLIAEFPWEQAQTRSALGGALPRRGVVIRNYEKQYLEPIRVQAGDAVHVGREDDECPGWWWCTGPDGLSGWVPADLLSRRGAVAEVTEDYSANELSVQKGEEVAVERVRNKWARVRNAVGESGWIPIDSITFL